jgi:hypothetical protein
MGYSQFNEFLVLDFALMDDIFILKNINEADVHIIQADVNLRRCRHGVVFPKHDRGGYFTCLENGRSARQKDLIFQIFKFSALTNTKDPTGALTQKKILQLINILFGITRLEVSFCIIYNTEQFFLRFQMSSS